MLTLTMVELPALGRSAIASYQKAERRIPDRAGDDDAVAWPSPAATHHGAPRQRPQCGDGYGHRPGRADRIATQEWTPIGARIGAQAAREGFEPCFADR